MLPTRADGMGCLLRALRAYVLFVLAGVAVTVAVGYLAAAYAVRRAEKAWANEVAPMERFAARYPTQPDSPAAVQLDALVRPLGIQLTGPRAPDPTASEKAQAELLKSIASFVGDCGRSGVDECPALPPAVAAFLERESARLDAIEAHVLQGAPFHWAQDITRGVAAPIPSLLGHRQLESVLLARALANAGHNRPEAADRSLEAGWVLNSAYTERPELVSRLIAVSASALNVAVLRTLQRPEERWLPRMRGRFAADLQTPYQLEAWNWTRYATGPWGIFDVASMGSGETPKHSIRGTTGRLLTIPYVRLSFAGVSRALLDATRTLRSVKRCDFDVDRYAKQFEDSIPRWNILGRIATPSVVRGFTALRYADLDRELTEQVLAARAERQATGRWPSADTPSTVCEGVVWQPRAGGDGSLTIGASTKPFLVDDPRWHWSIRLRP